MAQPYADHDSDNSNDQVDQLLCILLRVLSRISGECDFRVGKSNKQEKNGSAKGDSQKLSDGIDDSRSVELVVFYQIHSISHSGRHTGQA